MIPLHKCQTFQTFSYISGCLIMPHFQTAYGTADSTSPSGASLSAHRQSVVVALLSAGCFAGALLGVPTADYLGRRGAIFLVSVIFILGVIVQVATTGNLGAFLAGRFVAGLGVGVSSVSNSLYILVNIWSARLFPPLSLCIKEKVCSRSYPPINRYLTRSFIH